MKHVHHVIPRHMGGTDDPSNLVELTVEAHSEAHRKLFEEYGKVEDYVAWKALAGIIGQEEVQLELRKLGRKRADEALAEKYGAEWRSVLSAMGAVKGGKRAKELGLGIHHPSTDRSKGCQAALSESAKAKRLASFKARGHQQGEKNSRFGQIWITDGTNSKTISKGTEIPTGWRKGRIVTKK
jgi:hypothetical protein